MTQERIYIDRRFAWVRGKYPITTLFTLKNNNPDKQNPKFVLKREIHTDFKTKTTTTTTTTTSTILKLLPTFGISGAIG
jgi:hypothetical protein